MIKNIKPIISDGKLRIKTIIRESNSNRYSKLKLLILKKIKPKI
jgi:hypothetical protein